MQIKLFYTQKFSNLRDNYIEAILAFTHHSFVRVNVSPCCRPGLRLRAASDREHGGSRASLRVKVGCDGGRFGPIRVGRVEHCVSPVWRGRAEIGGLAARFTRADRSSGMISVGGLTKGYRPQHRSRTVAEV